MTPRKYGSSVLEKLRAYLFDSEGKMLQEFESTFDTHTGSFVRGGCGMLVAHIRSMWPNNRLQRAVRDKVPTSKCRSRAR